MKRLQQLTLFSFLLLIGQVFLLPQTLAQTYQAAAIPAAPGEPGTLFGFVTPTGPIAADQVVVGRFVTDYAGPVADLNFRLDTHNATKYPFKDFDLDGGLVSLTDADLDPTGPTGQTVGVVRALEVPGAAVAPGYRLIQVQVQWLPGYEFPAGHAGQSWIVKVQREAAAINFSGFSAAGTGLDAVAAQVTRPRLEVDPPTLDFGEVQVNLAEDQTPIKEYTLRNVGTGALTITGSLNPPLTSPFAIFGSVTLQPLLPMASLSSPVQIRFRPIALGAPATTPANQVNVAIASDDPASPATVTLRGTGVTVDAVLLLDLSDSMNESAQTGNYGVGEVETKLWKAKEAGLQLFQAYRELTSGRARIGVYGFPDPNNPQLWSVPTATKPVPINEADLVLGPVTTALGIQATGGLKADGMTPMARGIEIAQADLQVQAGRKPVILLLSDGYHNLPLPRTLPLDQTPTLKTKGIRVYSVAFGAEGQGTVDHGLLQQLANETDGEMLAANPSNYDQLKKAFRGALREWLGMRDTADPAGSISANQQRSHDVCLEAQAYTATFVVDWNDERDDAIAFNLETPLGELITPTTPGVAFFKSKSYAMYVVKGDRIRGGAGAGLWRLRLSGNAGLPGTLNYQYSVLTQSVLDVTPKFPPGLVYAGDRLLVRLEIPKPVLGLLQEPVIEMDYDAPAAAFGTFIANSRVEPGWVFGAPRRGASMNPVGTARAAATGDERRQEPASIIARKVLALAEYADLRYPNERVKQSIRFADDGRDGDEVAGDGIYTAAIPRIPWDGLYHFRLKITDALQPQRRSCFSLDTLVSKYAHVGLASAVAAPNLVWRALDQSLFFDPSQFKELGAPPAGHLTRMAVMFTPKDALGNLWGPGQADRIRFELKGGEPIGEVIDNWDGSYLQVVQFPRGTQPAASVAVGEFRSEAVPATGEPTQPRSPWVWVLIGLLVLLALAVMVWRRRSA